MDFNSKDYTNSIILNSSSNSDSKKKALKNESDRGVIELILKYKVSVYTFLCYCSGLIVGTFFYRYGQSDTINKLIGDNYKSFERTFIICISVYIAVYILVLFLKNSVIGFRIVYAIPVLSGITIGLKLAYYYLSFLAKGVSYSVLMIIPYAAAFMTVLYYMIEYSVTESRKLYELTKAESLAEKPSARKMDNELFIFPAFLIMLAILKSSLTLLIGGIITI